MTNPIEIMFNKQRRAALGLLLLHPSERFYVREISRLTGVAAGSLHRELRLLTDAGLLIREHNGNNVYYQANENSQLFSELVAIFHKTNDLTGVLRDSIMPLGERVAAAFIFHPTKDGKAVHNGDVNLFVIGSVTNSEVEDALEKAAKLMKIKIEPKVMRADEFSSKIENGDNTISEIMSSSIRFVKGFT